MKLEWDGMKISNARCGDGRCNIEKNTYNIKTEYDPNIGETTINCMTCGKFLVELSPASVDKLTGNAPIAQW